MAAIYKLLGLMMAMVAILTAVFFCGAGVLGENVLDELGVDRIGPAGLLGSVIVGVVMFFTVGFQALLFYAAGEAVQVLIAIEENTRATVRLLERG